MRAVRARTPNSGASSPMPRKLPALNRANVDSIAKKNVQDAMDIVGELIWPQRNWETTAVGDVWPNAPASHAMMQQVMNLMCLLGSWTVSVDSFQAKQAITTKVCKLLGAERSNIYLFDSSGQLLELDTGEPGHRVTCELGEGIVGTVAATLQPMSLSEAYAHPSFVLAVDQQPPTAPPSMTMLVSPLRKANGEAVGVIQVVNKAGGVQFTIQDEFFLHLVGLQASAVLEASLDHDKRLLEQQYATEEKVPQLLQLADQMFCCPNTDRLILLVGYQACRLIPSAHSSLFLAEPDGQRLWTLSGTTASMKRLSFPVSKETTAGWTLLHGETLNVANVYSDGRFNANIDAKQAKHRDCCVLCVPIRNVSGSLVGVIELVKRANGELFSKQDEILLQAYAEQVALALQQVAWHDEQMLLARRCQSLSSHLELPQAVVACKAALCGILRGAASRLYLLHPNGSALCCAALPNAMQDPRLVEDETAVWIPMGQSVVGMVAQTRQMMNVPDAYANPLFSSDLDVRFGVKTQNMICVPLSSRKGDLLGVAEVINKVGGGGFSTSDEDRLRILAEQIGRTLENCDRYRQAERMRQQGAVLTRAACELFSEYDLSALTRLAIQQARELLMTDHCAIFIRDLKTDELWTRIEGMRKERRFPMGQGIIGHVASTGLAEYVEDAIEDPRFSRSAADTLAEIQARTLLCCPLIGQTGDVVGVIQLMDRKVNAYSEEDRDLLIHFLRVVSVAIENCNLLSRRLAVTQTGVPLDKGRRAVHATLSKSCCALVGSEKALVFVVHPQRHALVHYSEKSAKVCRMSQGIVGTVAETGNMIKTENVQLSAEFDPTVDQVGDTEPKSIVALPIHDTRGSVVGVLSVQNKKRGQFTREDIAVLQGLCSNLGEVVLAAEVVESSRKRHHHLQAMLTSAQALFRVPNARELMLLAGKAIEMHLHVEHCSVLLYHSDTNELLAVGATSGGGSFGQGAAVTAAGALGTANSTSITNDDRIKEIRFPVTTDTVAGCVCTSGHSLLISDVYSDERFGKALGDSLGKRCSMACVPILDTNGAVMGVIEAINPLAGPFPDFGEEDVSLLQEFAALLSTAIANVEFFQRTLRTVRMMTYFQQVSKSLIPAKVEASVCSAVEDAVSCERVFMFSCDNIRQVLTWSGADGSAAVSIPFGRGVIGGVGDTGEVARVVDAHKDPLFDRQLDLVAGVKTRTMLAFPIKDDEGEIRAVVAAINKRGGGFSVDDVKFVEIFATQAGIMLRNALESVGDKREHEKRVVFSNLVDRIMENTKAEELMETISSLGPRLFDVRAVQLYIKDKEETLWTQKDSYSTKHVVEVERIASKVLGQAFLGGHTVCVETPGGGDADGKGEEAGGGGGGEADAYRANVLCAPVPLRLGVLEAMSKKGGRFDEDDRHVITILGRLIGIVLARHP